MVDRDRVLAKLDELDGHVRELRSSVPEHFDDYQGVLKRACERLLQISIEAVIDVCSLLVTGLRLGLPGLEDDLFDALRRHGAISETMAQALVGMKGLRNLLVHEYARVDDQRVFRLLQQRLGDFAAFRVEILQFLGR